jgi:hypothetical protein
LIDVYPADKPDGGFLLRAAREILQELMTLGIDVLFPEICAERIRFKAQLEWLEQPEQPPRPAPRDRLVYDAADIQGGILTSYDGITHGCLVMVSIGDRAQAQAFIDRLAVTTEGGTPADGIYVNIAFTIQGLRRLGLPEPEIERFPKEFREGMEARADLLGDLRTNHPRKWTLPERNWPDGSAASQTVKRVELSEVDIVVQLRISSQINPGDERITGNPSHPLHARVSLLGSPVCRSFPSSRCSLPDPSGATIDHFGFVDGISQPVVESGPALRDESTRKFWNNQVKRNRDRVSLGEILCATS